MVRAMTEMTPAQAFGSRRPKVAFVCLDDASDPNVISGGPHKIREAFRDLGCETIDIFPIRPWTALLFLPRKIFHRLRGQYYHWEWEPLFQRRVARHIEAALAKSRPDLVYVVQPQACSELVTDIPIAMSHDQTFIERLNYFPFEQRPPCARYVGQAVEREGRAFRNLTLAAYPSERSVAMIQGAYGIDPDGVAMVPWGGNLAQVPSAQEAIAMMAARPFGPFILTFIGVDWKRKGGDVVVEAHRRLRAKGLDVRLNIIGVQPQVPIDESVTVIPFIDKGDPADTPRLWAIMAQTHLLFVPSRVEAFGHVFCEAAAFAVPSVATNVGGIPTIVDDGVSGRLLPPEAGGEAFADAIAELLSDRRRYTKMAEASRRRYDGDLNWEAFCTTILQRIFPRAAREVDARQTAA
jgi:glycosyltransferase involved in cell wall biosynthesis